MDELDLDTKWNALSPMDYYTQRIASIAHSFVFAAGGRLQQLLNSYGGLSCRRPRVPLPPRAAADCPSGGRPAHALTGLNRDKFEKL